MRLKLDENLPESLVGVLAALGHDVHSVPQERLGGKPDEEIWSVVQREGRLLITMDLDFSDVRQFQPGTHHGVLLLRLHNPTLRAIASLVTGLFTSEAAESWTGCFVVATEDRVRVIRPGSTPGSAR